MLTNLSARVFVSIVLCIMGPSLVLAAQGDGSEKKDNTAIILASFGTTVPSGVESIINIQGLGSTDGFAGVFVNHIRAAAKEAGIPLP